MIAAELMGSPNGVLDPKDKVTIPAKAGSILIFPGTTPHRSLNSVSSNIRWSADFRLHRKTAARPGKTALDWCVCAFCCCLKIMIANAQTQKNMFECQLTPKQRHLSSPVEARANLTL